MDAGQQYPVIMGSCKFSATSSDQLNFRMWDYQYLSQYQVSSGANKDLYYAQTGTPTNSWHHVAMVSSGSAYSFYLDGVNLTPLSSIYSTGPGDWWAETPNRDNYTIGGTLVDNIYYVWDGMIDDVRVYPIALTTNEVQTLMSYTHPTNNLETR